MLLDIAAVLDAAALARLRPAVTKLKWRDGRVTAGSTAKQIKRNEQADPTSAAASQIQTAVQEAVTAHPVIRAAARPRRLSHVLISRMNEGGRYGPHVDNATMGKGNARLRSDLSYTLFLSRADDYDGGELVVHSAGAAQSLKADAGDLVLYPSTSIHEVTPVTRGQRLVAVGWIESMIADGARRELLFDLENLRISLRGTVPRQSPEALTLDKAIANLLRMWTTP